MTAAVETVIAVGAGRVAVTACWAVAWCAGVALAVSAVIGGACMALAGWDRVRVRRHPLVVVRLPPVPEVGDDTIAEFGPEAEHEALEREIEQMLRRYDRD